MSERSYDEGKLVEWYDSHSTTYDESSFQPTDERYAGDLYRIELVAELLGKLRPERVLDIGCGTAEPMIRMLREGHTIEGFDLSPGMIAKAKEKLTRLGYDESLVRVDNLLSPDICRRYGKEEYGAVIANGVLPYIEDDGTAHDHLASLVKPGGYYIGAYSNALFDLFTFNRFTVGFLADRILPTLSLSADERELAVQGLRGLLTNPDMPRSIPIGARDDVYVRSHVHFEVQAALCERGLVPEDLLFYKFHAFPPLLKSIPGLERSFVRASRDCEIKRARDWQAMFMSSTFIIVARKPD